MITDVLYALLVPLLIILGGIILVLAGWLLFTRMRGRSARTEAAPATPGDLQTVAPSPGVEADAERARPAPGEAVPAPFLAAERTGDGWAISVKGQRYTDLEAVPDPQVRADVVSALRAMAGFARAYIAKHQAGGAPAPARPATHAEPPETPAETGLKPTAPTPLAGRLARASSAAGGSGAPSAPRETLESQTRRVMAPDAMIPTIDFAHEISDIVDELLSQRSDLQGHSVWLTNLPGGGISFAVDGKIYHEIDEIPDTTIRDLIRQATREWERR